MQLVVVIPQASFSKIEKIVCFFAAWSYVNGGVSREYVNKALQVIRYIMHAVLPIVQSCVGLQTGKSLQIPAITLPKDVRTAYTRYFVEPVFTRTMCCPRCYYQYPGPQQDIPLKCVFKFAEDSPPCNEDLWRRCRGKEGYLPRCLFTAQSFDAWLTVFLSRKVVDDALYETFQKALKRSSHPVEMVMRDLQDSPMWRSLYGRPSSPYKLVFGLYVDWFNMFGNKIGGMKHCKKLMIRANMVV